MVRLLWGSWFCRQLILWLVLLCVLCLILCLFLRFFRRLFIAIPNGRGTIFPIPVSPPIGGWIILVGFVRLVLVSPWKKCFFFKRRTVPSPTVLLSLTPSTLSALPSSTGAKLSSFGASSWPGATTHISCWALQMQWPWVDRVDKMEIDFDHLSVEAGISLGGWCG